MRGQRKQQLQLAGTFIAPDGLEVFGSLRLKGRSTTLHLNLKGELPQFTEPRAIDGTLFDLRKVSCLECIIISAVNGWRGKEQYHHADIFPHFVTIGRRHFKAGEPSIVSVCFSTQDLPSIFNDYEAFGHIFASKPAIESLVNGGEHPRDVEFGEYPEAFYFSGKHEIIAVDTPIGMLRVLHQPTSNVGGTRGLDVKDKLVLCLRYAEPVNLETCVERVMSVHRLLSLIAGRKQSIESISLDLVDDPKPNPYPLELHWMHAPLGTSDEDDKPHPGDVPLDAVRRPAEFKEVLVDWLRREPEWRTARIRYADCTSKGNSYGVDRLVAAANMFDILPLGVVSTALPLSRDLILAREECRKTFKRLDPGAERNGVLGALGRMHVPSLTKKVLHHVDVVNSKLAERFPNLSVAATTAVKCRNYFVHGGSDDFDFPKLEPLVPFLTDALEFVFATSDLISAGWDAGAWGNRHYSVGHSFTRFRWGFQEQIARLERALS